MSAVEKTIRSTTPSNRRIVKPIVPKASYESRYSTTAFYELRCSTPLMAMRKEGIGMRMSDLVAQYIMEMLEEQNGSAEIQRNELAGSLGCVPSQINYVITSRFTPEQGYIVESRRGGGGYIRISRVKMDNGTAIMHIINSVSDTLDKAAAEVMLNNMLQRRLMELQTAKAIAAALSDRTLRNVEQEKRDTVRADLFKNMLLTLNS